MTCKLSVIMGNYNKAPFIPLMFESILTQTRPADEILVVDDASTDDSVNVLLPFIARHPNARLIRNPVNRGANDNVNTLIREAKGDFVFFASSDDLLYPELFERGMRLLEAHPEAGIFSSRCDWMDMEDRITGLMPSAMPITEPGFLSPEDCQRALPRHDSWFIGTVSLFNRQSLIDEGGFTPELGSVADNFVSQVLALKHGACFDPAPLGAWRVSRSGVAWENSINIEAARKISGLCAQHMREAGALFPPGYPERWRKRYMFGARRLRLSEGRRAAARAGVLRYALAMAREVALTAWLFLTLRPRDLWPVLARRLHRSNLRRPGTS